MRDVDWEMQNREKFEKFAIKNGLPTYRSNGSCGTYINRQTGGCWEVWEMLSKRLRHEKPEP